MAAAVTKDLETREIQPTVLLLPRRKAALFKLILFLSVAAAPCAREAIYCRSLRVVSR